MLKIQTLKKKCENPFLALKAFFFLFKLKNIFILTSFFFVLFQGKKNTNSFAKSFYQPNTIPKSITNLGEKTLSPSFNSINETIPYFSIFKLLK